MRIVEYQDSYQSKWDNFVRDHPSGRFIHLSGFKKLVENNFSYPSCYFFAEKEGKILAILPSFKIGKKLVSQPFSEYGGLLFDSNLSGEEIDEIFQAFSNKIKDRLTESRMKALEIHDGLDLSSILLDKYFKKIFLYSYAVLELDSSDNLWREKLNYEVKKAINKAQENSVKIFQEVNERLIREIFYPLYLISMKRLASPPHNLSYFLSSYRFLKDNIEFFWAELNGRPIAGLLGWKCGQRIQITDAVSNPKFWESRANDLVHWHFIKWAAENGFKYFDFGPARYEGQVRYKKKWGCQFSDYYYYYLSARKKFAVKKPLDDTHTLIKILSFFWKNFIPLKLTPYLGEYIRKKLGK